MSPSSLSNNDPHKVLQKIFAEHLANHMEGLVLKAEESQYNEYGFPWVKLKKDYIEGFGDCVDLVIVGASWDRDRARELRGGYLLFFFFFFFFFYLCGRFQSRLMFSQLFLWVL